MNRNEIPLDPSLSELVWNDSFRRWVMSNDQGSDISWNNWIRKNPGKESIVNSAREIILSMTVNEPGLSDEEIASGIQKILDEINSNEKESVHEGKSIVRKLMQNKYWMGLAASILLAVIVGAIFLVSRPVDYDTAYEVPIKSTKSMTVRINKSGSPQNILMPDGSKIILETNSRISYPAFFTDNPKRKIYLSGNAYFEVAKNPSKPFLVYTDGLITKVLGTKFFIRSSGNSEKKVSVEVISGIVAVYSYIDKKAEDEPDSKKLNSLILTTNQKANYSSEDKTLMATIVPDPVVISPQKINFNFEDTFLDSVFRVIEKAYGIDVIYDEKSLAKRTFTARLDNESLYDKMDIICKAFNAHYEVIDGKIVVYANEEK